MRPNHQTSHKNPTPGFGKGFAHRTDHPHRAAFLLDRRHLQLLGPKACGAASSVHWPARAIDRSTRDACRCRRERDVSCLGPSISNPLERGSDSLDPSRQNNCESADFPGRAANGDGSSRRIQTWFTSSPSGFVRAFRTTPSTNGRSTRPTTGGSGAGSPSAHDFRSPGPVPDLWAPVVSMSR